MSLPEHVERAIREAVTSEWLAFDSPDPQDVLDATISTLNDWAVVEPRLGAMWSRILEILGLPDEWENSPQTATVVVVDGSDQMLLTQQEWDDLAEIAKLHLAGAPDYPTAVSRRRIVLAERIIEANQP